MLTSMTPQCKTRWVLYLAWLKSAPDVQEQHKAEYSAHLATCPACRSALSSHASGMPNPELTEEEINNA
jgi:hypothetical protein